MASAGNNGSVQLWQDGKKVDGGHCQYLSSFICPTSSYSTQTIIPGLHMMWYIEKRIP
jgi:hypothetical protein